MPKYALLSGNVVSNLIFADTLEEANTIGVAVQCKSKQEIVAVGWVYDPETETFSEIVNEEINA